MDLTERNFMTSGLSLSLSLSQVSMHSQVRNREICQTVSRHKKMLNPQVNS